MDPGLTLTDAPSAEQRRVIGEGLRRYNEEQAGYSDSRELAVLVSGEEGQTRVGSPLLDGAKVTATVVDHGRESKVIVFKKKRRKHYKRTKGHRQGYTTLKIESIG